MNRTLLGIFVALTMLLTACGGGQSEQEAYEPAYYGNDDTEQCYFVDDPDEVRVLKEDGLCEQDWNPAPWPEDDFAGFYPFFFYSGSGSHHYRDRYVPKAKHGNYASKIKTFESNPAFKSKVATLSPKAQYKSSTGKVVTGNKVGTSFGARTSSGGGIRPKGCAAGVVDLGNIDLVSNEQVIAKGGGSSGGGSRGGGGGGSKSSGGGGSKSGGSTKSGGSSGTTARC